MKKFDVDKYRRKNPAPPFPADGNFRGAVIIPAYDELADIGRTLDSLQAAFVHSPYPVTAAVVINHPPGADTAQSEKLHQLIDAGTWQNVSAIRLPDNPGGVGAARKAGMDAFIHRIAPEDMEKSVIFSLDADTVIEEDYFSVLFPEILTGGAISIPFSHQQGATPQLQQAIDRYEAYMARYVQKLSVAGSPYAFHTIGSAFAVRADVYVRSGGMRQKQAGEDFYFLQAVAKSFPVKELPEKLVHPSGRISQRVPFGTGRAVENLLNGGALPEIPNEPFAVLKQLLEHAHSGNPDFFAELPQEAKQFLEMNQFQKNWNNIVKNTPQNQLPAAFDRWFDGLQTLRFLHFLQEKTNDPS